MNGKTDKIILRIETSKQLLVTHFLNATMPVLNASLITLFFTISSYSLVSEKTEAEKPNILYIFTDQQFGDAMSNTGNPHLKTPAMDKIAAHGLRFDNAYCAFPLCVPSRMSMFSGRMPHQSGIFANTTESAEPYKLPMVGKIMKDNGYETHWTGKWHLTVPENQKEVHGFNEIFAGGGYGGLDSLKAANAVEFLSKKHAEPFFLVVSLNNPHDCCELSRGQELKMDTLGPPPGIDQLPPLPANVDIPEKEPDFLRRFQYADSSHTFPAINWSDKKIREYTWGYYRLVEKVDNDIATILDALERYGLEENTIIIFSSDHGDGLGMHRWNQKWSLYEESARVPLIVSWKGKTKGGKATEIPVSAGLDLLPTICDFAGIEIPDGSLGKSLRKISEGKTEVIDRKYVVTETGLTTGWASVGEDNFPKARMVRSERYKYILFDTGNKKEQLFDMVQDPGEMSNLVDDTDYAHVLQEHRAYFKEWKERTNDSFEVDFL